MSEQPVSDRMKAVAADFLSRDKSTYLNMTKSVARHYNRKDRNGASSQACILNKHVGFRNYVEDLAESLGVGLKVRLTIAGKAAQGNIVPKTTKRVYKLDKSTKKLVQTSKIVIETEPRVSERLKALEYVNRTTGHEELVKEAMLDARRSLEDMYNEQLSGEAMAAVEQAIDTATRE